MNLMTEELRRRLLFVIHRGLVEARLLAKAKNCAQIFDLTDALEPIPGYMTDWEDSHLEIICFNLKKYRDAYPSASFDYLRYLEVDPPPQRF